jgi:acyl-coenzyme A synthetase/AMP-(fatty) acid ligase
MIKSSGYRISPAEVEEVLAAHPGVLEAVAFGVPHPLTGDAVGCAVRVAGDGPDAQSLLAHCRRHLPSYMVPATIATDTDALPRNPNGKFDRMRLRAAHLQPESREAAHA